MTSEPRVASFVIGANCFQSYPCKHDLIFRDGSVRKWVGAREIVLLCHDEGFAVPKHFEYVLREPQMVFQIQDTPCGIDIANVVMVPAAVMLENEIKRLKKKADEAEEAQKAVELERD